MPAMPPTSAVPPLRTLRRVIFVMRSSPRDGEALDRSDAGLGCLSDDAASAIKSMHALWRVPRVVLMIDYWCTRASGDSRDVDVKQGKWLAGHALQPVHEPCSHALPSHAAMLLPQLKRVYPVLSLGIEVLTRHHCRPPEREIKCYLCRDVQLAGAVFLTIRSENEMAGENRSSCCIATAAK